MKALLSQARQKWALESRRMTAGLRYEPTALIIGAQKAGTTSLYDYLAQHPRVGVAFRKEVRYFHAHYERGLSWYRGHFPLKTTDFDSIFEASPGYMLYPQAAQRIEKHYPQMKLIAILRHPVERAYSHYKMNLWRPNVDEQLTFADAIAAEADRINSEASKIHDPAIGYSEAFDQFSYLARGRYWEHLQHWYACFSQEQICVILAEDLFTDTATVYDEILQFLGLPPWRPEQFKAQNQSGAASNLRDKIGGALYDELVAYFEPYNAQLTEQLGIMVDWT